MKSECGEYKNNIAAYCLGDLAGEEKQALEAHFATCARCRSEHEDYTQTLGRLASVGNEEVPRHFFIYPEEQISNPWQLFRRMPLRWQTAFACAAMLVSFVAVAATSRLQIRSDSKGWAVSFGAPGIDTATLKEEILAAAEKRDREAGAAWAGEMRNEFSRYMDSMSYQQQARLATALNQMDSRFTGRIKNSEGQVKDDTRVLVSDMYRLISQQRARDLESINLRFDSTDANNAIKARQTNEILGTLLQVADLKLK